MDKSKYFLDLSKCTEEKKHIKTLTGIKNDSERIYLSFSPIQNVWGYFDSIGIKNKTEITYPEFIKLFEGGDGENNGRIKIGESNDLPRQRGEFWFVSQLENGKIVKAYFNPNSALDGNKAHYVKLYSHYQPVIKPEPPKF